VLAPAAGPVQQTARDVVAPAVAPVQQAARGVVAPVAGAVQRFAAPVVAAGGQRPGAAVGRAGRDGAPATHASTPAAPSPAAGVVLSGPAADPGVAGAASGGGVDGSAAGSVSRAPVAPVAAGGGSAASAFAAGAGVAGGLLAALVCFVFARARFARALVAAVRPRSLAFVAVLERPG
jgi:hypothetical protein